MQIDNVSALERARRVFSRADAENHPGLRCTCPSVNMVSLQAGALHLFRYVSATFLNCDAYRRIFCEELLRPDPDFVSQETLPDGATTLSAPESALEALFSGEDKLWKQPRAAVRELCHNSFMLDPVMKHQLAMLFSKHYRALQRSFMADSHSQNDSFVSLTLQLFTVPSIAVAACSQFHVFRAACTTLVDGLCSSASEAEDVFGPEDTREELAQPDAFVMHRVRHLPIIGDIDFLCQCSGLPLEAADYMAFLDVLSVLHRCLVTQRQALTHVPFEEEENTRHILCITELRLLDCAPRLTALLVARQDGLLLSVARECVRRILALRLESVAHPGTFAATLTLPLHRFLAHLIAAAPPSASLTLDELGLVSNDAILHVAEDILRCFSLCAQIPCRWWVRNGMQFIENVLQYSYPQGMGAPLIVCDRLLLQFLCRDQSAADAIADRYFFLSGTVLYGSADRSTSEMSDLSERALSIAEHAMAFLYGWVVARNLWPLSDDEQSALARRIVLHTLLCVQPHTRTKIRGHVSEDIVPESQFRTALQTVAVFRAPVRTKDGTFELKEEFLQQFDPLFEWYAPGDRTIALQHWVGLQKQFASSGSSMRSPESVSGRARDMGSPSESGHAGGATSGSAAAGEKYNPPKAPVIGVRRIGQSHLLLSSQAWRKVFFRAVERMLVDPAAGSEGCSDMLASTLLHCVSQALALESAGVCSDLVYSILIGEQRADTRQQLSDDSTIVRALNELQNGNRSGLLKSQASWLLEELRKRGILGSRVPDSSGAAGSTKSAALTGEDKAELVKRRRQEMMERMREAQAKFVSKMSSQDSAEEVKSTDGSLSTRDTSEDDDGGTVSPTGEVSTSGFVCMMCQEMDGRDMCVAAAGYRSRVLRLKDDHHAQCRDSGKKRRH